MSPNQKIRLGIVGACGRGGHFKAGCEATGRLTIHAVCDLNAGKLEATRQALGAREKFTDYEAMLDTGDVQAVLVGTPMQFHAEHAIAALRRGIHVLCEVTAAVSVAECQALVQACRASRAVYMMAENYTYLRTNQVIKELVRRGEFGTPYYAEGEYLHDLKELNERTPWRRKWQAGVNGVTYGTHSLGPILQWMPGDRVASVCCAGAGHHYRDPRGAEYETEDTCLMLCQMRSGGLVKIRMDMLSNRPHAMTNYQLQGTTGCYESTGHRIWLRSKCQSPDQWLDLASIEQDYLPENWIKFADAAKTAGHGGGDLIEMLDFVAAIDGTQPCPIGIHEALDMTLPGLISQESIAQGGAWLPVPDSRDW